MTYKDLMVGDYVTFRECQQDATPTIIKVWQINGDNEAFVSIDGNDSLDEIAIDDEVVGIPITPEILEKNGFVYNDLPFEQLWQKFGLSLYRGGDGYRINCGENVSMIIDYVHQLQHALRLCGIEKEIVL